ncbi:ABC transporter ATP-binding protein [Methylosinus sp. PW1]|uniref:ABC transporter ATP-binding protein n=1 Tax=Methylosinus sp. PW1 TaxID=107636 RepID=UPI000560D84F|nr:ABC transporter ATP-binding protein [Methylosinus sp. PW1]
MLQTSGNPSPADDARLSSPQPGAGRGRIELKGVSVSFGEGAGLFELSLTIEPGEFLCLLGPSGCGKSTALNAIGGFVAPSAGKVAVDGATVRGPGPDRGIVFQHYSLFPWKTAQDNVAFGLRMQGASRAEARRAARDYLATVGLARFAQDYPAKLSGGMQQRVAIARALVNRPAVLLMDEPFGALDAQTRALMQEHLLEQWREVGNTVVFVTHDVDEALFLGDRVVVLSAAPGRVLLDLRVELPRPRPREIYASADFIEAKARCLELIRRESRRAFEKSDALP